MSDISDEIGFLTRNPRSNVELLRKLCETQENDFLLHNDEQVKVKDLEGKVVLLLRKMRKLETSALEDVYLKLQRSCNYSVEVVFIHRVQANDNPEEFERAVASAPWPVVSKPWLIDERHWMTDCIDCGNGLVVVDEKGNIFQKR